MFTESRYLGKEKVFFQVSFPFFVFFPPQVIIFKGGLLWSSHARRSSAEAPLPQRLPHLHLGQTAALRQPHAGGCQAALGEDEEEEGGHRHPHQRQEEGQAEHRFVKALLDITLIYPTLLAIGKLLFEFATVSSAVARLPSSITL